MDTKHANYFKAPTKAQTYEPLDKLLTKDKTIIGAQLPNTIFLLKIQFNFPEI